MILSIHQPSYFPWLGLLDKIHKSDVFMVMDEVQLSDSLYQHRNLFVAADGAKKFLTIPIVKKGYREKAFRDIEIASSDWRMRHLNFIWNSYRKHPFADEIMPRVEGYYAAGARCYLSGTGGRSYLDEAAFSEGLSLRFNVFQHPVYSQKGGSIFQQG